MTATINWDSIGAKLADAVAKKVTRKIEQAIPDMISDFKSEMDLAIVRSPEMTVAESERVSLIPFEHTGTTKIILKNPKGFINCRYKLYFDFVGDKTMVSLSPNKSVRNLVALFNNGYASNNIDPSRPVRGMWHGMEITIYPRSRHGAHFIGTAIQNFKRNCAMSYPHFNISFNVSPEYIIES